VVDLLKEVERGVLFSEDRTSKGKARISDSDEEYRSACHTRGVRSADRGHARSVVSSPAVMEQSYRAFLSGEKI
jgi:hypothetical protein